MCSCQLHLLLPYLAPALDRGNGTVDPSRESSPLLLPFVSHQNLCADERDLDFLSKWVTTLAQKNNRAKRLAIAREGAEPCCVRPTNCGSDNIPESQTIPHHKRQSWKFSPGVCEEPCEPWTSSLGCSSSTHLPLASRVACLFPQVSNQPTQNSITKMGISG